MRVPTAGQMTTSPTTPTAMQALEEQRLGAVAQLLGGAVQQSATIVDGEIKPTAALVAVDTEGAAASDDLDRMTMEPSVTVSGFPTHGVVILRAANTSRTVVVRSLQGTTGNDAEIELAFGSTFALDDDSKRLVLEARGTKWVEVDRYYAADASARRSALGTTLIAEISEPGGGDEGKLVTASSGTWVYTAAANGGDGVRARSLSYPGGTRQYEDNQAIRFEQVDYGTPSTDDYSFLVPSGATWCRLEAMCRIEQQDESASASFVSLTASVDPGNGKHDSLLIPRGLPARSAMFQAEGSADRKREVNVAIAGTFPVTPGHKVAVVLRGAAGTTYRVFGGRTKSWLAFQWM